MNAKGRTKLKTQCCGLVGRLIDSLFVCLFVFLFVVGVAWPLNCRPLPLDQKRGDFSTDDSEQGKGLVLVNLNDDKIWAFLDKKRPKTHKETITQTPLHLLPKKSQFLSKSAKPLVVSILVVSRIMSKDTTTTVFFYIFFFINIFSCLSGKRKGRKW